MKHLGVAFFVLLLIQNYEVFLHVEADDGFVTTKGVQLILNGSPFYANGFNAYWMMYVASDSSQRDKVSSAFQDATKISLRIARTWAFSDGGYRPLQYSPGSYNEQMFQVSFDWNCYCFSFALFFFYILFCCFGLVCRGWIL